MSSVALRVYQRASPTTLIAALDEPSDVSWADELTEVGAGRCMIPHDSTVVQANPTILDRGNIVRVRIDGTDRFAWRIDRKRRTRGDSFDPIRVTGPGVLDVLNDALVYPEYGLDRFTPDTRLFGFMSKDYDDSAWTAPDSHGPQSNPGNATWAPYPKGWVDSDAEWIWDTHTAGVDDPGDVYFRAPLVLAAETDVIVQATADDEFLMYLDGAPILESSGPFQWRNTFEKLLRLEAGTHTFAVKATNLQRPYGDSPAGFIASVIAATASGEASAIQEVQEVFNDATGGTFTLSFAGQTTSAIAYNASAATIESELEGLSTIDGVTVTGSGTAADPWEITWDVYGNQPTLTADDTNLTGHTDGTTINVVADGAAADVLLRTNTTDWVMLAYPATHPGMTPGEILRILVDEAQARESGGTGTLPAVTLGFTDTQDSDSVDWPDELEIGFQVGAKVLYAGQQLAEHGVDIAMSPTMVFDAWDERGSDVSGSVQLAVADCAESTVDEDDQIANTLLVRTEQTWFEWPDPAPTTDRHEEFLSLGTAPSQDGAENLAEEVRAAYADSRDVFDHSFPDTLGPDPYVDFEVGDTIDAPGLTSITAASWSQQDGRVLAIGGRETETGTVDWTVQVTPP